MRNLLRKKIEALEECDLSEQEDDLIGYVELKLKRGARLNFFDYLFIWMMARNHRV